MNTKGFPQGHFTKELDALKQQIELDAVISGLMRDENDSLKATNAELLEALEHCGYDPDDCIDCGGPPHNEYCRFWKLRHVLSYWEGY